MKFRNNKGFVMTDATIAVIILLILVPTIMGLVYNIQVTKRTSEVKAEAINILTNTIEASKGINIENVNANTVLQKLKDKIYIGKMSIDENQTNAVINTNNSSYKVYVEVIDYADSHSTQEPTPQHNTIKTVIAKVEYRVGGQTQELTLKTLIRRLK